VDFLCAAGQRWWQMLPIHPPGGCDSPYDSPSAFAGSTMLISVEDLVSADLLEPEAIATLPPLQNEERVDFVEARRIKEPLLAQAFARFGTNASQEMRQRYQRFLEANNPWVWDYALFTVLRELHQHKSWVTWEVGLRTRNYAALEQAHIVHQERVRYQVFCQFIFHDQWNTLRRYANERGVLLMGDVPMFVSHDSSDVWANQHMFFLDEHGERTVQAGVPPDYFSEDGQLWGNPLYRWEVMKHDGFGWWLDRLRRELAKFDALRIDHFIALRRYWEIPVPALTAKDGRYVDVPGYEFFDAAQRAFGGLPFVAEDLGILTEAVEHLRDHFGLPGMKVLQFAFFPGAEAYLPHRHQKACVAYVGTHDNDTSRGWFESLETQSTTTGAEAKSAREQLARLAAYTGITSNRDVNPALRRALLTSPANTVILTAQDLLDQDARHRTNVPGIAQGNWAYRMRAGALTSALAAELRALTEVTERLVNNQRS
jgi:4-alpha-glucanotransferase